MAGHYSLFEYYPDYKLILCKLHKYAVDDVEKHLQDAHEITGKEKHALCHEWSPLQIVNPKYHVKPPDKGPPRAELGRPIKGFRCKSRGCGYLSKTWSGLVSHWDWTHNEWPSKAQKPTDGSPTRHARVASIQTLFPYPKTRWFEVKEDRVCSTSADPGTTAEPSKECPERRSDVALERCAQNERSSYFHRLPYDLRFQIYDLVLIRDTTFHIADLNGPAKPALRVARLDEGRDELRDEYRVDKAAIRAEWYQAIKEDLEEHGEDMNCSTHFRAISIPPSQRLDLGLIYTCRLIHAEVAAMFYSRNKFLIHSRCGNFSTASGFINSLHPDTRHNVQAIGVLGLLPHPDYHSDDLRVRHYAQSEKEFLLKTIPEMTLKELTLSADCDQFDRTRSIRDDVHFSPQARWLKLFLRLPLDLIDVRIFKDTDFDPFTNVTQMEWLLYQLNAIDGAKRIRGSLTHEDPPIYDRGWFETLSPDSKATQEARSGPHYPFNDIWAEPRTEGLVAKCS